MSAGAVRAGGPAGRDRAIDAARAVAIAGVVGGHWLVTGLVVDGGGAWRQASPLTAMPALAPVTWLLQTLGLFFFTGGFAAARSRERRGRSGPPAGARARGTARLARWVGGLLGVWAVVLAVAAAAGTPAGTLRTIAVLVAGPLWFLGPYLLLRAATAALTRVADRFGAASALPAAGVVAGCDAGLLPGWCAVPAAWSVPWMLGVAVARGRPPAALPLLLTGAAGMALLIGPAGYPASAVGVPGDGRSNLAPPSLVAVALAAAQIGVFLLWRGRNPGAGLIGPARGRWIASLDRAALPIYLCHQSVLVTVVAVTSCTAGPVPGLLTAPADPSWIVRRGAWLPFLALVLAAVIRPRWRTPRRARADEGPLNGYAPPRF
jgi:hypothetical protein